MPAKLDPNAAAAYQARETAIAILTWLAGEPELMSRFLAITGLTIEGLRRSAESDGFYLALTSFLMDHEPTLMAFCEDTQTPPKRVAAAHTTLSGHPGFDTNAF